jgi:hypothetical protein
MFILDIPLPGFDEPTTKQVQKLLVGYKEAAEAGPVRGGIVVEGDAAAYALVWEWGNVRQVKQGPKTVKGINPDGSEVWMSIQAPSGYIAIHETEFLQIINYQLGQIDLSEAETGKDIRDEMKKASLASARMIAEIIRDFAPVDKGALREGIEAADPDDPDLAVEDDDIELGD